MFFWFSALALLFCGSGALVGVVFLAAAFSFLTLFVFPDPQPLHYAVVLSFALAPVASGLIGGLLTERYFLLSEHNIKALALPQIRLLGTLLGAIWIGGSVVFLGSFSSALNVLKTGNVAQYPALLLSLVGQVLFCGTAVALVIMLVCTLAEFITRWLLRSVQVPLDVPWIAFRSLTVFLVLGLGLQLVGGLFATELSPLHIVREVIRK